MVDKKIKINLASICFYMFWMTLLIGKGMGYSSSDAVFRYMTFAVIPFAAFKLLLTHWYRRELVWCIFLNIIGLVVWIFSGEADILLTTIAITSCKNIDLYKLFKVSFWIKGLFFFIRTSLAIAGVIDKQIAYRWNADKIYDIRYALGYEQPNATHYTLFVIVALALLVYRKRMELFHYIILMIYNLYIYSYTLSRTGVAMISIILVLGYICGKRSGILVYKGVRFWGQYAYIVGATGSFLICFLFEKVEFLQSFGNLSSRFMTGTRVIKNNPLTLFGVSDVVTDFGYIAILYGSGIVVFGLFIVGMSLLLMRFAKYNLYMESIVLVAYAVYTLSESYSSSVLMNVGVFFLAWIIYPMNGKKLMGEQLLKTNER